ncbi:cytochrome C family protein [Anaeromyxobacter sp. K]|uniref:CxxxxCH/CxxCH domain c-type cytochrome n=1 Tax=Anaeromyxobacter sp. (strain K) TaxID=447217 RepID=UPI00015F8AB8|nr:CxxxxCH/CxxCH domain-containing protein [Anaeromyxobacter sp. K]ACG74128.1 cytochrome C family protein [Anaeromyxobacter sp. K]
MRSARITPLVLTLALLAACSARKVEESAEAGTSCTRCHGGVDNLTGAPPRDAHGSLTGPKVGAHTAHLGAGVACETCHKVPSSVDDPDHIGPDTIKVRFGQAAKLNGAAPTYAAGTGTLGGTCSSTYCHGSTLFAGGTTPNPSWNQPKPSAAERCQACHGNPPPSHSALATNCFQCHSDSVDANQEIKPGGKHVDGHVDIVALTACAGCHGDPARTQDSPLVRAAPPVDTQGNVSGARVGAHLAHLRDGPLAKAFACSQCHVVPTDSAHASNGAPVVTFGPLASLNATPSYANGTCSGVYCHGGGTTPIGGGGLNIAPTWTQGTAGATCGSCHALVPPSPHPSIDRTGAPLGSLPQCSQCHPGTVNPDGSMFVANGLHVNGVVDQNVHPAGWLAPAGTQQPHGLAANFHDPAYPRGLDDCRTCHGADLNGGPGAGASCNACHAANGQQAWQTSCTFCHGEPNRAQLAAAPPVDSQGHVAPSERGVGAHQTHLFGKQPTGAISNGVACGACHDGQPYADIAHVNGTVAVALKTPGGAAAGTFDAGAGTCASTYCHGGFRGGKAATPAWTATSVDCGSCHASQTGTDLSDAHATHVGTFKLSCGVCHSAGYAPGATPPTADKALHVNGLVDVAAAVNYDRGTHGCTVACHGPERAWY